MNANFLLYPGVTLAVLLGVGGEACSAAAAMNGGQAQFLVQWAGWAGEHALALFFVSLAVLVVAAWAFLWAVLRYAGPVTTTRLSPLLVLAVRVAVGFGVIVGGAAVFAELGGELGAEDDLGLADQAFTDALAASVPPAALAVFGALTRLGDTAILTGVCIAVALGLWLVGRRWLAAAWVMTVSGGGLLNSSLKLVFARARPAHDGGIEAAEGFSFPSGHSSGSVVTYGMLAYLALRFMPSRWHVPVALAMSALAGTIGASRMFLRVHFASDVIAGFALGVAWLGVCVVSIELTRWYRGFSRGDAAG